MIFIFFFFNDTATTEIYTLSYTTLFRSLDVARNVDESPLQFDSSASASYSCLTGGQVPAQKEERSEEHTSELQSRLHLVCRLLLEKKKKKKHARLKIHNIASTSQTMINA